MGRVLCVGIVSRIEVIIRRKYKKSINMDFVNSISKSLNKYINTKDYEKEYYKDGYAYRLKENIFNDNIHDLIKEVSKDINIECFFEYEDIDFHKINFNKEDYPIILETNLDSESEDFGDQTIIFKKDNIEKYPEDSPYIYNNNWLIGNNEYKYDVRINLEAFTLWSTINKIRCESEYETLEIMNTLKKKYKNRLGKNVIFFIYG